MDTKRVACFVAGLLLAFSSAPARRLTRALVNSCPEIDPAKTTNSMTVVAPILSYTVTTFDPSWFSSGQSGNSPSLFTLVISPSLDTLATKLRLRVYVEADTTLGRNPSAPTVVAFDGISDPLTLSQIGVPLTSAQVFNMSFSYGTKFTNSPLYDIVVAQHRTPEMNLHFKFRLTCEDNGYVLASNDASISLVDFLSPSSGKLRFVRTVQALSPGTDVTNPKPVSIYTLTPIFQIASELFNNQEFVYPPGEPKMEISIYQVQPGQNPTDALNGVEFAKFPVPNQYPVAYPPGLPMFTPGMIYTWRARALLRGPDDEYRYSNPLYFLVDPLLDNSGQPVSPGALSDLKSFEQQVKYGDDYVKRVMAALKVILGDNFDIFDASRANKIPARGQIRLNGQPYSLEDLEKLAREFQQAHHSVTRVRFQ